MKFGVHCFLFVDRWSDAALPVLERARELGLDCLEIAIGDDVFCDWRVVRRQAGDLGLELAVSPGGTWPDAADLSADDEAEREGGLAWHKRQVDVAAEAGAHAYTGALYGRPGVVRRRRPPPEEWPRTAEGVHALAEYGRAKGVAIVLEPMSHFRSHVVNTPEQVMQLIALADHDNLHVLFDTYHMITEVTDYGAAIRTVADRLWGLHASENNRGVPGTALVPWDVVFRTLKDVAFDGYVLMETYNSSIGDFAWERGMFHNVCPDGAAFVRAGLPFLKSGLT
jgi:D-psicose/D-tagatose/L-ribulose 3-epimerase